MNLVVSKWVEGRFILVPEKVPGTGNSWKFWKFLWKFCLSYVGTEGRLNPGLTVTNAVY